MPRLVDVRLTVFGAEQDLNRLEDSTWRRFLRAKHIELYEFSNGRRVWWFQTERLNLSQLAGLSIAWPRLTLFLDYEDHADRVKGLLRAWSGNIDRCQFTRSRNE